jgi:hypothetical protein
MPEYEIGHLFVYSAPHAAGVSQFVIITQQKLLIKNFIRRKTPLDDLLEGRAEPEGSEAYPRDAAVGYLIEERFEQDAIGPLPAIEIDDRVEMEADPVARLDALRRRINPFAERRREVLIVIDYLLGIKRP